MNYYSNLDKACCGMEILESRMLLAGEEDDTQVAEHQATGDSVVLMFDNSYPLGNYLTCLAEDDQTTSVERAEAMRVLESIVYKAALQSGGTDVSEDTSNALWIGGSIAARMFFYTGWKLTILKAVVEMTCRGPSLGDQIPCLATSALWAAVSNGLHRQYQNPGLYVDYAMGNRTWLSVGQEEAYEVSKSVLFEGVAGKTNSWYGRRELLPQSIDSDHTHYIHLSFMALGGYFLANGVKCLFHEGGVWNEGVRDAFTQTFFLNAVGYSSVFAVRKFTDGCAQMHAGSMNEAGDYRWVAFNSVFTGYILTYYAFGKLQALHQEFLKAQPDYMGVLWRRDTDSGVHDATVNLLQYFFEISSTLAASYLAKIGGYLNTHPNRALGPHISTNNFNWSGSGFGCIVVSSLPFMFATFASGPVFRSFLHFGVTATEDTWSYYMPHELLRNLFIIHDEL